MALKLRNLSGSCKTFRNHEPLHPDVQIRRRTILLPESAEQGLQTTLCHRNEYFTAFCGLILLGVFLYLDIFALVIGKDFRAGMGVVPIMLLSYMLLGMLFNVSMWYKLSGKTNMAIWITLAGLAVTIVVNVVFMPRFSFWAAAFGHLASYLVMFVISAVLGNKYYPIPYSWKRIFSLFGAILIICLVSMSIDAFLFPGVGIGTSSSGKEIYKLLIHTVLIVFYMGSCLLILKGRYRQALAAGE